MESASSSDNETSKKDAHKKTKFLKLREQIPEETLKIWEKLKKIYYFFDFSIFFREQSDLVSKIKESDDFLWTSKPNQPNSLQYVNIYISLKKKKFVLIRSAAWT